MINDNSQIKDELITEGTADIDVCSGICSSCRNSCGEILDRELEFMTMLAKKNCTGQCAICQIYCNKNENPEFHLEKGQTANEKKLENEKLKAEGKLPETVVVTPVIEEAPVVIETPKPSFPETPFVEEIYQSHYVATEPVIEKLVLPYEEIPEEALVSTRQSIIYDDIIKNNEYYKHNTINGKKAKTYDEGKNKEDGLHFLVKALLEKVEQELTAPLGE